MLRSRTTRPLILLLCGLAQTFGPCQSHAGSAAAKQRGARLEFVVILSRHGVRSPTGDPARYAEYSRAAWPKWDVPPGYLTPHGFEDMKLFGAWDRELLARQGLLAATGCGDAAQVSIVADSDQRTRESGRALAEGMFPGCAPAVHALPQGTRNPLFHPPHGGPHGLASDFSRLSAGRETARNLTQLYRPQIAQMDHILATCGPPASPDRRRVSLFDAGDEPRAGRGRHPGELPGPLRVAATLSENFLLEYTQGMPLREVGWGCVSEPTLRSLMVLHTAAFNYEHRNPAAARVAASNLLAHIRAAMRQAVEAQPVPGAPDQPGDRVLFLVGHDTNLATVAALMNLHWTADGRRDDTPPGSALVFELWRSRHSGRQFVRLFYTAQTLDQMRHGSVLTPAHPPLTVPLAINGCSTADSCSWAEFLQLSGRAIDPDYVSLEQEKKNAGGHASPPQSGPR